MTAEVKRKTYSRDFKIEAVKFWQSGSHSAEETAKSLGISVQSLRMWKKELAAQGVHSFRGRGILPSYEKEMKRLKQENERLRIERDILKKAVRLVWSEK